MTGLAHDGNTVRALLARRAADTPSVIAFQREVQPGQWQALSWREFGDQVGCLGAGLRAAGLRKGDRLALITPVSLEWELLHHAALSIGAVVVGLDAHDLPERLGQMAELADITAFAVSDPSVLRGVEPERLAAARFVLRLGASEVDLPTAARMLQWQQLVGASTPADVATPVEGDARAFHDAPAPDDIATIIFTSGTTGAPKGIAYSHRQLCLAVEAIGEIFSFTGTHSRLLCWLPLSNLFQRVVNLVALRRGAATYLLGDPRRVMDAVAAVSPDVFIGVPRFLEKLHDGLKRNIAARPLVARALVNWAWNVGSRAAALQRSGQPVPPVLRLSHRVAERLVLQRVRGIMGDRLRCMVTGSAPAPVHLLESFHGLGWLVLEAYGLSENVLPMSMNRLDRYRFGTVGLPLAANQIRLDDQGVVRVRSAGLFSGYLGDPRSGAFRDHGNDPDDGSYRTGDIGSFDADGFLRLIGRTGDLIKTSTGRRVAPASVEARLRSIDGIDLALLLGDGRKALVALCTMEASSGVMAAQHRDRVVLALRAEVQRVSEFERPVAVLLVSQPFTIEAGDLTPNLKLRRAAILSRLAPQVESLYREVDRRAAGGELIVMAA